MKYGTKLIYKDSDWLDRLDGLMVIDAIEYLKTLQPYDFLNYSLEGGDLSGVEVTSALATDTETEITFVEYKNDLLVRAKKELKRLNDAKEYYLILCSERLKQQRKEQIINLDIKIKAQITKIETIELRTE